MGVPVDRIERFRVVLLYDRLALAGRAMATYRHLARALEDDFKPAVRIWRLEAALSPEYSARAGDDFAAAELIVIAVGPDQPCPAAVRNWWSLSGGRRPRGIVALVGPTNGKEEDNVTWGRMLKDVATEIHPGVFVCDAPADSAVGGAVLRGGEDQPRPSPAVPVSGESPHLTAT